MERRPPGLRETNRAAKGAEAGRPPMYVWNGGILAPALSRAGGWRRVSAEAGMAAFTEAGRPPPPWLRYTCKLSQMSDVKNFNEV